jgi:hypothetical protein
MVKNVHWSSYKVPNILVRFQRNLNFLKRILKNTKISIFVKILLVGAELFFADRRIDMMKSVAFRNFANAPKNDAAFWRRFFRSL